MSPGTTWNSSPSSSRNDSRSSSRSATWPASASSWRAENDGDADSDQATDGPVCQARLAVALDLHCLLERRSVDPVDERLRDGAERAHSHRVEALLVAIAARVLTDRIAAVQLHRVVRLQCRGERLPQLRPALGP